MRRDPMHMSAAIRVSRLSRSCRTGAGAAVVRVVRHRKSEDGQPGSEVIASRRCAHMRRSSCRRRGSRSEPLSGPKDHDLAGAWNTR